jgi:formylmethanofuran dehydrogenase subunit E
VIPSSRPSLLALLTATATASLVLVLAPGCAAPAAPATPRPPTHAGGHPGHPGHRPEGRVDAGPGSVDARLAEVARAHGGAGPWAVAGYRMGAFALRTLGLDRGSFDLEIVHYTPREVQYACIADGAAASTGASVGKLNLSLAEATPQDTRTVYRRRAAGGATITLRITQAFAARFLDVARERLGVAGREAMELPDSDVFEIVP